MHLAVIAPIQWFIDLMLPVLEFIHDTVGFGWGLSIITLTILLRLAILPLAVKSFASMRGLQAVAPQLKELQVKYKDDRQRLSQETMKLYSENKVNPFGSCLPLLLQMPFLIAFYYMLRTDLKPEMCGVDVKDKGINQFACSNAPNPLPDNWHIGDPIPSGAKLGGYGEHFLGISDITAQATGALLILLLVLYVGSQVASSLVNMPPTADKNQKRLFIALPFIFVLFLLPLKPASGLFLYWITTNVFTLFQQYGLRKYFGDPPAPMMAEVADAFGRDKPAKPEVSKKPAGSAPPPPPRKKSRKRTGKRR